MNSRLLETCHAILKCGSPTLRGMARSASERLVLFENLRDKIESALLAGAPIVSYSVDGQTVVREPTSTWLAEIDARISGLRGQTGTGLAGRKNLVRFTND